MTVDSQTPARVQGDQRLARARPATGLMRWAPVVGFGLLMVALSRHAGEGISDPDTLWHVLAGDHLRHTWQFSGPDPFSSFTTQPWVLNQWLPELALSFTNQWFGLAGVAWLAHAARVAVCLSIYLLCRRQAGPLPAAASAALAVLGTASNLSPRPQLVGFVLLAVTVGAWLATTVDRRPRWWLVPLGWVWASCHGTWVVGVLLGVAVVIGMALDRRVSLRAAACLMLLPALCTMAALLTPVGPRLFSSLTMVRSVSPYIEEWQRPTLTEPSSLALLGMAALIAVTWALRRSLASWSHAAIAASGLGWGLMYGRGVALGAVMLAPLAALALDHLLRRHKPPRGRETAVVAGFAVASLALAAIAASAGPTAPTGVPTRMSPILRSLPADSVVYNDDLLGGWLMWSFPELEHTADTRVDLYGPTRAREYLRATSGGEGARQIVASYEPRAAIVNEHSPLLAALEEGGSWDAVVRDAGYVLLVPAR